MKLATATSSLAEVQPKKIVHCWGCGEANHTEKDPNCSKKKIVGEEKAKPKPDTTKSREKTWGKEKKAVECSHCGKSVHSEENCFVLHPGKRPTSSAINDCWYDA